MNDKKIRIGKETIYCSKPSAVGRGSCKPHATVSVQASRNTGTADKTVTIIKLKYSLYSQCQTTRP